MLLVQVTLSFVPGNKFNSLCETVGVSSTGGSVGDIVGEMLVVEANELVGDVVDIIVESVLVCWLVLSVAEGLWD